MKLKTSTMGRAGRVFAATMVVVGMAGAGRADSLPNKPTSEKQTNQEHFSDEARLRLYHLHTGESIDVAYKRDGQYLASGIAMLNRFLRDHRTEDTADYDPREFDLLHALQVKLGRPNAVIDIVCGYRTPWSNNYLRTRRASTGVAEHSQHMLSRAIDIRIPGVSTLTLRNAALSLGMGGVGYYPTSQFVHVDVGPVRQWQYGGRQSFASRSHRHSRYARSRHRA